MEPHAAGATPRTRRQDRFNACQRGDRRLRSCRTPRCDAQADGEDRKEARSRACDPRCARDNPRHARWRAGVSSSKTDPTVSKSPRASLTATTGGWPAVVATPPRWESGGAWPSPACKTRRKSRGCPRRLVPGLSHARSASLRSCSVPQITAGDETHTRMVSVTADPQTWQPTSLFDTSTLNCLRAADPQGGARLLDSNVYPTVYAAWERCRKHIVEQNAQALREAAAVSLPKPMRDAMTIIRRSSALGAHHQERLLRAYNTMPSRMVQNRVRAALRRAGDEPSDRTAERLTVLAERLGLSAQAARSAMPRPITAEDVRLIAWLAIKPEAP